MIEIPHHRYKELLAAKRAGCCDTWPKPCEPCNQYADGLERGYREGGVDSANHPAVQTLRYVAPFIQAAIAGGVWQGDTEGVEHELAAALAWADRRASADG